MAVNGKPAAKKKSPSRARRVASAGAAARRATTAGAQPQARSQSGPPARNGETPKPWTFLTNHAHVLILLHGQPDLVLREVAARVGITERAVQRIVQDLEEEGFIRRHKVGRRNEYEVLAKKRLRHPVESHRKIGDLLDLMARP